MPNRVIYYHFTPEEVRVMHRLTIAMGWIDHQDEELVALINHISKIVEADELATRDSKTT